MTRRERTIVDLAMAFSRALLEWQEQGATLVSRDSVQAKYFRIARERDEAIQQAARLARREEREAIANFVAARFEKGEAIAMAIRAMEPIP